MEPKYYFAKSKLQVVRNIKDLGPSYTADLYEVYHAFQWSIEKEDYLCTATAVYKGCGVWLDEYTDENVSSEFNWADYLVKRK